MNRMIRRVCPTLGKAIVLCACALTLMGDISAAFDSQEPSGPERHHRHQGELTFSQIDPPGAITTLAYEINDRGQIVGDFFDAGGVEHGFILVEGVFTQINFPGAPQSAAIGINKRSQIVGIFQDAVGAIHGFFLTGGVFTRIDVPGAMLTRALGINDRDQIVGDFQDAQGAFQGS